MGQEIIDTFREEIDLIQYGPFKAELKKLLLDIPNYILTTPSSSSGKYHPPDEIEENGMILHVKRFIISAEEMIRMYYDNGTTFFKTRDILIATAILHDIFKQGRNNEFTHTVKQHPILIYDYLREYIHKEWSNAHRALVKEDEVKAFDEIKSRFETVCLTCLFHEGRWTIPKSHEKYDKKKLTSKEKRLVFLSHLADMIASRRPYYNMMQEGFGQ